MSQEKTGSGYTPMNMVEYKPELTQKDTDEVVDKSPDEPKPDLPQSGYSASFNKSFDTDFKKGSLADVPQYNMTVNLDNLPKTPFEGSSMLPPIETKMLAKAKKDSKRSTPLEMLEKAKQRVAELEARVASEAKKAQETAKESGQEDYSKKIKGAASFEELEQILNSIGSIKGSTATYSAEDLITAIKNAREKGDLLSTITRSEGLRDKVAELYIIEGISKATDIDHIVGTIGIMGHGGVELSDSSGKSYDISELIDKVTRVYSGELPENHITSKYGLRDKVLELRKSTNGEALSKPPETTEKSLEQLEGFEFEGVAQEKIKEIKNKLVYFVHNEDAKPLFKECVMDIARIQAVLKEFVDTGRVSKVHKEAIIAKLDNLQAKVEIISQSQNTAEPTKPDEPPPPDEPVVPQKDESVTKVYDLNSISANKLRESNPGITDEQIKAELQRRQESFKELLKSRKELKESFSPYYESKKNFSQTYQDQLKGGYEMYKKTGWLGKMFGFNPKNLNSYATTERLKYADSRTAYREKLEQIFNNRINNLGSLDRVLISGDRIRSAMTDRFLLRPARETLRIQNESFPEADRRNILNKFKDVIKRNPRAALVVGTGMVAGTIATGGLAAIIPMLFGATGATLAGILSTKFGVNKSERALDSALKNAKLGTDGQSTVEAEMKLVGANQDVEISKNRRDVYTTAGGVAGGMVGGALAYDFVNNGADSILRRFYDSIDFWSDNTDAIQIPSPELIWPPELLVSPPPDVNGFEIPPTTPEGPEVTLPDVVEGDVPARPEGYFNEDDNTLAPHTEEAAPGEELEIEEGEQYEDYEEPGEDLLAPPAPVESLGSYIAQPNDNYWNIMEGQTNAPQPPVMEWMKYHQPEHYQELIKLVEYFFNNYPDLRAEIGFGDSMDNLQIGSEVNLDSLNLIARSIAEHKGWIVHVDMNMPELPPELQNIINSKVKSYIV